MNSAFPMIITLVLFGGMMFFMTRSQKKQQQERQKLINSMKAGDKVVTIGGLHGVVSEIDSANKTVLIDCEGIVLEFDHTAIRTVKPNTTGTTPEPVTSEEPTAVILEKEETVVETDPDNSTNDEAATKD